MTINKLPSQSKLLKLFHYEPETGNVHRKVSVSGNTNVGDLVGCKHSMGYLTVRVGNKEIQGRQGNGRSLY